MSDEDHSQFSGPTFAEVKRRVIDATGMVYFHDKDEAILSATQRAFKLSSQEALEPVFQRILANKAQEFNTLIDELTIGETFFFRHTEMFEALKTQILPEILERNAAHRLVRIWSAGCSIGAEPYSISILLHELLGPEALNWKIEIVGSDINRKFLRTAVKGEFAAWALRGVSEETRQKYFQATDTAWRLKSVYRSGVHFRYYNLIEDPEAISKDFYGLDLLICRNVMIYFDTETNRRLVNAFYDCLKPDAWLLVGHAENHHDIYRKFRIVNTKGAVLYRKGTPTVDAQASAPAVAWKPLISAPSTLPSVATSFVFPPLPVPTVLPKAIAVEPLPPPPTPTSPAPNDVTSTLLKYCDAGQFTQALELAEQARMEQPKNSDLFYLRGMIHAQLGNWDAAREDFKSRLFFKRDCVMTHYQLSLLPQERPHAQKHLRNADKILSSLPSNDIIPLSGGLRESEMRLILSHQLQKLSS